MAKTEDRDTQTPTHSRGVAMTVGGAVLALILVAAAAAAGVWYGATELAPDH